MTQSRGRFRIGRSKRLEPVLLALFLSLHATDVAASQKSIRCGKLLAVIAASLVAGCLDVVGGGEESEPATVQAESEFSYGETLTRRVSVAPHVPAIIPLGDGKAGDRIIISNLYSAGFPVRIGLFEETETLIDLGQYDPWRNEREVIIRADARGMFLAVWSPRFEFDGMISVRRFPSAPPLPMRQRIYLDFRGATAFQLLDLSDPISFPAVGPDWILGAYPDHWRSIAEAVVQAVKEDFAPYRIEITSSFDASPPSPPYSSVFFGGGFPGFLGSVAAIDQGNINPSDRAIVYTDEFALYRHLPPEEMALIIAGVASHEIGHLLGLFHTAETEELMGSDANLDEIGARSGPKRARLHSGVAPIGFQDGPRRLSESVGLTSDPVLSLRVGQEIDQRGEAREGIRAEGIGQRRPRFDRCRHHFDGECAR